MPPSSAVVPQLHDIPGISGDLVISARSNSCSFNDHETYDANVRIRDLPKSTDTILNMLASARGILKWELIREILMEYAESHKTEIADAAR